jgi:hypothetical protein
VAASRCQIGQSLAYADGALTSGIREAKRLLATPAVRITVDHAR